MDTLLTDIELRIIGSLIEKKLSTPDYYPLTLNSLTSACNQKTSRNPVTAYTEDEIHSSLKSLINKRMAWESTLGRAPKYEENFSRSKNLDVPEISLISVLMLRGSQTLGELKINSEKMHMFASYDDLNAALESLADQGLIRKLPKQPGQKEARYAHLLCGEPQGIDLETFIKEKDISRPSFDQLISDLESMKLEIEQLKASFAEFKKQFE